MEEYKVKVSVAINGDVLQLSLNQGDSILRLKELIEKREGIGVGRQFLYCLGYLVDDDDVSVQELLALAEPLRVANPLAVVFPVVSMPAEITSKDLDTDREAVAFAISKRGLLEATTCRRATMTKFNLSAESHNQAFILVYNTLRKAETGSRLFQCDFIKLQQFGPGVNVIAITVTEDKEMHKSVELMTNEGRNGKSLQPELEFKKTFDENVYASGATSTDHLLERFTRYLEFLEPQLDWTYPDRPSPPPPSTVDCGVPFGFLELSLRAGKEDLTLHHGGFAEMKEMLQEGKLLPGAVIYFFKISKDAKVVPSGWLPINVHSHLLSPWLRKELTGRGSPFALLRCSVLIDNDGGNKPNLREVSTFVGSRGDCVQLTALERLMQELDSPTFMVMNPSGSGETKSRAEKAIKYGYKFQIHGLNCDTFAAACCGLFDEFKLLIEFQPKLASQATDLSHAVRNYRDPRVRSGKDPVLRVGDNFARELSVCSARKLRSWRMENNPTASLLQARERLLRDGNEAIFLREVFRYVDAMSPIPPGEWPNALLPTPVQFEDPEEMMGNVNVERGRRDLCEHLFELLGIFQGDGKGRIGEKAQREKLLQETYREARGEVGQDISSATGLSKDYLSSVESAASAIGGLGISKGSGVVASYPTTEGSQKSWSKKKRLEVASGRRRRPWDDDDDDDANFRWVEDHDDEVAYPERESKSTPMKSHRYSPPGSGAAPPEAQEEEPGWGIRTPFGEFGTNRPNACAVM